jgi:high-affinity nickel-transport protein
VFASFGAVALGVLLGLRHAFEPDHLTAVSTLVTEAPNARRGMVLGAIWGVGHTISLVVIGSLLLVTGAVLPVRAAASFELAVAAMLVLLGVRSLVRALREGRDGLAHRHHHGGLAHFHPAPGVHLHVAGKTLAWRPLAVGLVHGLAGSGAITALVFAGLPTTATRITYIALFGIGSIAGMSIASGVAGASLRVVAGTPSRRRGFALATGALSIVIGVVWAIPELALL